MSIKPLFVEKLFFFISNFMFYKRKKLNCLRVIIYHFVPKEYKLKFQEQIKFISDNFRVLKPDEIELFFEGKFKNDYSILITFDDGLKSQFYNALEILEKFSIKALFFIPTKILSLNTKEEMEKFSIYNVHYGNKNLAFEKEFMNKSEILELKNLNHKIGSHSVNHKKLKSLDNKEIYFELFESKSELEKLLNDNVIHFAYPKGDKTAISYESYNLTKEIYKFSFIAVRGFNYPYSDKHLILRDPIHPYYPFNYLKNILYGNFDFYYRRKIPRL